jgi:hypothetical protein
MNIIHFSRGATDPLTSFGARAASFFPLLDSEGNSHVSRLHLDSNAAIDSPSLTHATALLVVHGRITVTMQMPRLRMDIHSGMGCVLDPNEAQARVGGGRHSPHCRI